jgi:hypothetical protein
MDIDEDARRTLTRISAVLQIAHADTITDLRDELMKDKANEAIFKATSSWTTTAELETAVVRGGTTSRATLFRRLADLVDRGLLERREVGKTTEYRNSGLI